MWEAIDKEAALKLVSDSHNPYHRIVREFLLTAPTVPDIDLAAILRLCNEIRDIAMDIRERTMNDSYFQAQCIIDKARKIGKELGDAGTD